MLYTTDPSQKKKKLMFLLVIVFVLAHNTVRTRNNLHKKALVSPHESPFHRLIHQGDATSFLMLTGFTRSAFNVFYHILFDDEPATVRTGRPQSLHPYAQLGLYLFFIGSTMGYKHLCMIFGVTPMVCSRTITKMLALVARKLKRHPLAQVVFPDEEKMDLFAGMIHQREHQVRDVIGFMDGLCLNTECTSEPLEQNAMYTGNHSDTMINNVFAYGPDGKVFLCAINFPGSWHDGSICANILPHIKAKIGTYKICVDTGFPRCGEASDILVGPYTKKQVEKLSPLLRPHLLMQSNVYTSLRQASEWGMRGLQGSFPRCKKRLPGNTLKRKRVIESIVLTHNLRTDLVGQNQIKTVFDPEYCCYVNISGYDRIKRYYFNEKTVYEI